MVYIGYFDATLRIRDSVKLFASTGSSILNEKEKNPQFEIKVSFSWAEVYPFYPAQEMPRHFLHTLRYIASF